MSLNILLHKWGKILTDIHYFIAEPIYSVKGNLYAVEVLTRFTNFFTTEDVEDYFSNISTVEKVRLIHDQADAVHRQRSFFQDNHLLCSFNVDYPTVKYIIQRPELTNIFLETPYFRLELHESTTLSELNDIRRTLTANKQKKRKEWFWFDDFSSDKFTADFNMLSSGFIRTVKIDKNILLNRKFDELAVMTEQIRSRGCRVIVEGVETDQLRRKSVDAGVDYLQGYFFPRVEVTQLSKIPLKNSL